MKDIPQPSDLEQVIDICVGDLGKSRLHHLPCLSSPLLGLLKYGLKDLGQLLRGPFDPQTNNPREERASKMTRRITFLATMEM